MKLIVRLVFALLGALAGSQVAASPEGLPFHLLSSSSWARWTLAIVVGALAGLLVGWIVGGPLVRGIGRVERAAQARPAGELVVGGVGLVLGLGAAALATFAVRPLPYVGRYLLLPLALVLGYLFAVVGARSHRSILRLGGLGATRIAPRAARAAKERRAAARRARTRAGSAARHARGHLGDHRRPHRRPHLDGIRRPRARDSRVRAAGAAARGRLDRSAAPRARPARARGRARPAPQLAPRRDSRGRVPDVTDVDAKLVRVAHDMDLPILTTDYNLNKVAQIQGVQVLNVNDLANALKPAVLPGEALRVKVIREGKEAEQGVGYLDDGTMIVVEGARDHIGELVETEVTSVLQSPSGKMISTRLAS